MKIPYFVLTFDFSKIKKELGSDIAVPVDPNSFSSIRKAIVRLINETYQDEGYFDTKRLKIPLEIDINDIMCYKSDLSLIYYFMIFEII